jgi:hypothetical protein
MHFVRSARHGVRQYRPPRRGIRPLQARHSCRPEGIGYTNIWRSTSGVSRQWPDPPRTSRGVKMPLVSVPRVRPAVFIGSSSEGEEVAECLQAALEQFSESTVWSQGVFGLGETAIGTLVRTTQGFDFAVLVLTGDDIVEKRGKVSRSARDNVIFEAGLFLGALGLERTFLVMCRDDHPNLPSDLAGVTSAFYNRRKDGNTRAAINPAALQIRNAMSTAGAKRRVPPDRDDKGSVVSGEGTAKLSLAEERAELERELDTVSRAVVAQGWRVKTRSSSAFRVVSPDGSKYSLTLGEPRATRRELREFALKLNKQGVRLSRAILPEGAPPAPTRRRRSVRRTSK